MPDMSDSAWLAIKIKAETTKSESTTEAQSVEPLQKDVDNLLVTVSFSFDEETIQQISSNPDPKTTFNVMARRRRAEVNVSTLSAEQKRELVEAKDKELNTFVKYSVVEAASRQGVSPSAVMKIDTEKNSSQHKSSTHTQELTRAQYTGTRRPLHEKRDPHHQRHVDV